MDPSMIMTGPLKAALFQDVKKAWDDNKNDSRAKVNILNSIIINQFISPKDKIKMVKAILITVEDLNSNKDLINSPLLKEAIKTHLSISPENLIDKVNINNLKYLIKDGSLTDSALMEKINGQNLNSYLQSDKIKNELFHNRPALHHITQLSEMLPNLAKMAPSIDKHMPCKINGEIYCVWWSERFECLVLQKKENFLRPNDNNNKMAIGLKNGAPQCFVDNKLKKVSDDEWKLIEAVHGIVMKSVAQINKNEAQIGSLSTLLLDLAKIAPNLSQSMPCSINGKDYHIWQSERFENCFVLQRDDLTSKISVSMKNGEPSFYVNNKSVNGLSDDQWQLLEGAHEVVLKRTAQINTLPTLISDLAKIAPNLSQSMSCSIHGEFYHLWLDEQSHSLALEKSDKSIKMSISIKNGQPSYDVNNKSVTSLLSQQWDLAEAVQSIIIETTSRKAADEIAIKKSAQIYSLQRSLPNLARMAPSSSQSMPCSIDDETYNVWWDKNIEGLVLENDDKTVKMSISMIDGQPTCYVNDQLVDDLSDEQWELVEASNGIVKNRAEQMSSLSRLIKTIAPDRSNYAKCTIDDTEYAYWWSPDFKSFAIQKLTNFEKSKPLDHNNKISVGFNSVTHKYTFYATTKPTKFTLAQWGLVENLYQSQDIEKRETLDGLLRAIKFAPNIKKPKIITVGNIEYCLWSEEKCINIQPKNDFNSFLGSSDKRKISFSIFDPNNSASKPKFYLNGSNVSQLTIEWKILKEIDRQSKDFEELFSKVENASEALKKVAPSASRPLICMVNNDKYACWWNDSFKAINFQPYAMYKADNENWLNKKAKALNFALPSFLTKNNDEGKVGLHATENDIQCFADGKSNQPFDKTKIDLFSAINQSIIEAENLRQGLENAEKAIKPPLLNLMKSFMEAPHAPSHLIFGNPPLVVWIRPEELEVSGPQREKSKFTYLSFQLENEWDIQTNAEKITLKINEAGEIISLHSNGEVGDPSEVLKANSEWSKRLDSAFNDFLSIHAIKINQKAGDNYLPIGAIIFHPLALNQIPEFALNLLSEGSKFKLSKVKFLEDDLMTLSPGLDHGGLSKDFITLLSKKLMNKFTVDELPILPYGVPNLIDQENRVILTNFGKLLTNCLVSNFKSGRILPDNWVKMLKSLIELRLGDTPLTNLQKINLLKDIQAKEDAWLFEIYEGRSPTKDEATYIEDYIRLGDEDITDKAILKALMEKEILEKYQSKIEAVQCIAKGMHKSQIDVNAVKQLSPVEFSNRIQGNPFNREEIANRVTSESTNPVVVQKTKWLKEFILDEKQSKDWVLQLLRTITAQEIVTSSTRILISQGNKGSNMCIAHTCFNRLEVPITHTGIGEDHHVQSDNVQENKERFFKNLMVTMNFKGYAEA